MKVELLTREPALEVRKAMLKCRLEQKERMREAEAAEEQARLRRRTSRELNEELAMSFEAAVLYSASLKPQKSAKHFTASDFMKPELRVHSRIAARVVASAAGVT